MDFLDPTWKIKHRRRLLVGYALIAIAVALASLILLFLAYGYDIDRKTGSIIQNGIVFMESRPNGKITLNGTDNGQTTKRLDLPAGNYNLDINAKGYRTWSRNFNVEGGRLVHMEYPFLVPSILKPVDVQLYAGPPGLSTQSPDKRWLLVQQPAQTYAFDLFDTANPAATSTPIIIPNTVLSDSAAKASLTVITWSNDNRHLLVRRDYANLHEFMLIDRQDPSLSINLNNYFGVPIYDMQLKNKRADQFYILDELGGNLRSADSKAKTLSSPLGQDVLQFSTSGDNLLFTISKDTTDKVKAEIINGNKEYQLRTLNAAASYVLNLAKYNNHWYYAVGSFSEDIVYVYQDPLNALILVGTSPSVAAIIRQPSLTSIGFSPNFRFLALQSNNKMVVFDGEDSSQVKFDLAKPPDRIANWMDSFRLVYPSAGQAEMIDFDGSNLQALGEYYGQANGPYFNKDNSSLFAIGNAVSAAGRSALVQTPLIIK